MPMKAEKRPDYERTVVGAIAVGMIKLDEALRMVPDINKPAGVRCPHQRTGAGCRIYDTRPFGCRMWNCRWLVNDDTADLSRPDRSHYVIDIAPDFVTITEDDKPNRIMQVVQIWVDAAYPNAWREPALRAYIERRAREGIATLIRIAHPDQREAIGVFAPPLGNWDEKHSTARETEHTIEEKLAALGSMTLRLSG